MINLFIIDDIESCEEYDEVMKFIWKLTKGDNDI